MARTSSVVGIGKLVASAFLAMEQGKSTENVAINAAEVVAIYGQYGVQEKEKCMLGLKGYTMDERNRYTFLAKP